MERGEEKGEEKVERGGEEEKLDNKNKKYQKVVTREKRWFVGMALVAYIAPYYI